VVERLSIRGVTVRSRRKKGSISYFEGGGGSRGWGGRCLLQSFAQDGVMPSRESAEGGGRVVKGDMEPSVVKAVGGQE